MGRETLVRVVAPTFVAGFVSINGRLTECAPILGRHLAGRNDDQARAVIRRKGWKANIVKGPQDDEE